MRILLTGATGFCGRPLAERLLAAGHQIRAVVRKPGAIPGIETVVGDLAEMIDWAPLLNGIDAVIHLAAITAGNGIPDHLFDRINHQATNMLARAAASAGIRHFVFISSVSAQSGPSAERPVSEADAPHPHGAYGRSKLDAEGAVRASGVPFTILRPVMIYGDSPRGYLGNLMRIASTKLPLPFGSFRNRRSLLAIDNFISAVLAALSWPARSATFLVADPQPISLPEIIAAFRRGQDRRPMIFRFPAAPLRRIVGGRGADLVVRPAALIAAGWTPVADTPTFLARMGQITRKI